MVDAISNANRRQPTEDPATNQIATQPTRYIELDVDSIKTTPFVCVDTPAKATLFVDGIAPSDVRQGHPNTCALQGTLISLARTPAGRTLLKNHVWENRDPNGKVTSYTVVLYKKSASGAYEPKRIQVPASCLASRGVMHTLDHDDAVEVWPRVYEQAFLQLNGGEESSTVPDVTGMLTGRESTEISTNVPNLNGKLARGFGLGKIQIFCSNAKNSAAADERKLVENHAYVLAGIEARPVRQPNGSYVVEELYILRNPWGFNQPAPMTLDEVKRFFSQYDEGDVP